MGNVFLSLLGFILSAVGVILVYDARQISGRLFSFGDQNDASKGLKIFGFLIAIIGAFLIYFNI